MPPILVQNLQEALQEEIQHGDSQAHSLRVLNEMQRVWSCLQVRSLSQESPETHPQNGL